MSARASAWAHDQRADSPSAQCVLLVLADDADVFGVSRMSPDDLAERTRQTRATVKRRLRELSAASALTHERHGKGEEPATYETRLCLDQTLRMEVAAHEAPDAPAAGAPESAQKLSDARGEKIAPKDVPSAAAHDAVFVRCGSDAWRAWEVVYRCLDRPMPLATRKDPDGAAFALFPTEYPSLGRGLPAPISGWVFIEKGSPRWWGWQERLKRDFGRGTATTLKRGTGAGLIEGNWFPTDWPPAKHERLHEEEQQGAA